MAVYYPVGWIYLIHIAQPIGSALHSAQHYIGWASDLEERLAYHRAGRGSRLLAAAAERGISFEIVRSWPDMVRDQERLLKRRGHIADICPTCAGSAAWRRANLAPVAGPGLQLALDLGLDDLPAAPPGLRADWLEFQYMRRWRASMPRQAIDLEAIDACL